MSKRQRTILIIAGGALVLLLIYRWYQNQNQSSGASTASGTSTGADPSSSDYASLAGQEQSDVANLQQQNAQLLSQEQSDVSSLGADIQQGQATEQGDVGGLTAGLSAVTSTLDQVVQQAQNAAQQVLANDAAQQAALGQKVAALSAGVQKINRNFPWQTPGFFQKTLTQVRNTYHSPEATARFLFARGFRPTKGAVNFSASAGQTWHYVGPKGRDQLPQLSYQITSRG